MTSEPCPVIPSSIQGQLNDGTYPNLEMKDYLTYRISRLSRVLDLQSARFVSEEFGISLTERRILWHLAQSDGMTVRGLANELSLDKGRVSRAISSLMAMGCVARHSDPLDGRSAVFRITSVGRQLETDIVQLGRARQERLLNQLDAVEREHLYHAFAKLQGFLDADMPTGQPAAKDTA